MAERPLISTARLHLRPPTGTDVEAIFSRYASDPEVTRWLCWPTHASTSDTQAFVTFSQQSWRAHGMGPLLIFHRQDERLLGSTGLEWMGRHRASTGYALARDAWGQGFATEALKAMVEQARKRGLSRLEAMCFVEHRPSAAVLEKCGFEREGCLRRAIVFPNSDSDAPRDVWMYALLPNEREGEIRLVEPE